ncbi:alpha/beta hydrolase [Steroidobacter agaridevorans]|uniref:alpha/beta hydrolase n=1 Tax=Steroidobacter agaridevorans TaxID=2695856 RepID=UPI00132948A3|nr:alpha/beta hydrolase [Steroidobacter agaridevorans]GFE89994.1 alpha/beta hydrolase [Steroidobacter agaridevorans]
MSTFVLIHGGGDVGWSWHRVEAQLREHGHDVVAPDLPCDDDSAGLKEYADSVVEAIGHRKNLIVVGHSYGGFTAPLVAARLPTDALVLVAGMIPWPSETPDEYWETSGCSAAIRAQAARDGGLTGNEDPLVTFYHDVPRTLAEEALRHERSQSSTPGASPWPLEAWPNVRTHFVLCTEDRVFPSDWLRRLVRQRLRISPDEITAGHCVALSRPQALATLLLHYASEAERQLQ